MKKLPKNHIISVCFFLLYSAVFIFCFLFGYPMPISVVLLCYFAVLAFTFLHRLKTSYFLTIHIFTFVSELLGTGFGFYRIFPRYDIFLHFSSGILLFIFGLYVFSCLSKINDVKTQALFSFLFSLSGATVWEIWEYFGDVIFYLNSQGTLGDTMEDVIAGALGGLISYFVYTFIEKRKNTRRK